MDLKVDQSRQASNSGEIDQCESTLAYKHKYAILMLNLPECFLKRH